MRQDFSLLRLSCRIWTYDHVDRLLFETLTLPGTAYASAGTSSYDSNGALVSDTGRGISSITWNEINLPGTVTFSDGSSVAYCYAADGTKLRETRTVSGTATIIDWCGDLVLEKTGSGPRSAKRLMMDGGYVDLATGNTARRHFVRDHLGSVRAVVDDAGTVLEADDYYPLGGPLPTGNSTALQPQKYQGKDWNATASFNVYDFGARLYDPALGRWLSQDPLAEKYQAHSPYLFCAGNPMKFVDPDGMDWYQNNETKLYQFFEGNDEIDGFTNIGETISVFLKDEGIYENYFQNIIVSRTEEALNAKSQILSNTSLLGQYISTSSGLSDYSKNSLLSSAIHQGQEDFINHPITKEVISCLSGLILGGIGETIASSLELYSAQQEFFDTYMYDARISQRATEDPLFHGFPKLLDKLIIKNRPVIKPDGYKLYKAGGTINNIPGNYEIGIYQGKITHRFFKPIK